MSIFGKIMDAIFGKAKAADAGTAGAGAGGTAVVSWIWMVRGEGNETKERRAAADQVGEEVLIEVGEGC